MVGANPQNGSYQDTSDQSSASSDSTAASGSNTASSPASTGSSPDAGSSSTSSTGTQPSAAASTNKDGTPALGSTDSAGWKLVWSDEFNGSTIDASKWSFETQNPGWVNNELQAYTGSRQENVRLENGSLIIEARRDNFQGHEYTSARMKTAGKAHWKYGKFEARIKLSGGLGTWPAFWMMPEDQSRVWPACGEIDIMEEVGFEGDVTHATTHTAAYNWAKNTVKTAQKSVGGLTSDFHVYTLEWYEDRIDMFIDGTKYYNVQNENKGDDFYPFTKDFYIILNLAVGGEWAGSKGVDPNIWPRQMLVDWVRVYRK